MKNGTNKDGLVKLANWINSLDNETQINILGFLYERIDNLPICDENVELFYELTDIIEKMIIESNNAKEKVINTLITAGLNKVFAYGFYEHCFLMSSLYLDAKVIAKMSQSNLQNLCAFILDNIILYKEYTEIPFDDYMNVIGLKDKESAGRALRFIRNKYEEIANREYSTDTLLDKLINNYKIPENKSLIIKKIIDNKIDEVHQAYLLYKINTVLDLLLS